MCFCLHSLCAKESTTIYASDQKMSGERSRCSGRLSRTRRGNATRAQYFSNRLFDDPSPLKSKKGGQHNFVTLYYPHHTTFMDGTLEIKHLLAVECFDITI